MPWTSAMSMLTTISGYVVSDQGALGESINLDSWS